MCLPFHIPKRQKSQAIVFFKLIVFATMLAGPRINAGDKTSSCGLFLTCRGEKYVQYFSMIHMDNIYAWILLNAKNPLFGVVAVSA
jgi:hypothetical protein